MFWTIGFGRLVAIENKYPEDPQTFELWFYEDGNEKSSPLKIRTGGDSLLAMLAGQGGVVEWWRKESPAEERAERYAMEAASLTLRLIEAEKLLATCEKNLADAQGDIAEEVKESERLREDLAKATIPKGESIEQAKEEIMDLVIKVQYLVDCLEDRGQLEEHVFTFPDGDTWESKALKR